MLTVNKDRDIIRPWPRRTKHGHQYLLQAQT